MGAAVSASQSDQRSKQCALRLQETGKTIDRRIGLERNHTNAGSGQKMLQCLDIFFGGHHILVNNVGDPAGDGETIIHDSLGAEQAVIQTAEPYTHHE